jgi:hypothetical protein
LWRAALILSLSEQLADLEDEHFSYTIEGDVVSSYETVANDNLFFPCCEEVELELTIIAYIQ